MNISVRQVHIDKGVRGSATRCMMAKAILDQTGLQVNVYPCERRIEGMAPDGSITKAPVTRRAARLAIAFDLSEEVKPFSFRLDVEALRGTSA